jgi:hypothetical protein
MKAAALAGQQVDSRSTSLSGTWLFLRFFNTFPQTTIFNFLRLILLFETITLLPIPFRLLTILGHQTKRARLIANDYGTRQTPYQASLLGLFPSHASNYLIVPRQHDRTVDPFQHWTLRPRRHDRRDQDVGRLIRQVDVQLELRQRRTIRRHKDPTLECDRVVDQLEKRMVVRKEQRLSPENHLCCGRSQYRRPHQGPL